MAKILNINTSSNICSVALTYNGEIVSAFESSNELDHSITLAPFVEKCLEYLHSHGDRLDAVSVVFGPGSYTGIRIGLSLAKGIAYGYGIPLITLSSLEVMAVRAIFTYPEFNGDELIIPIIDARRMEVYTGGYNSALKLEIPEKAIILDSSSFKDLKGNKKILFIGDGTEKFKEIYKDEKAIWLGKGMAHAKYMPSLSEKYYRERKFSDIAYTVPNYLKEYMTTASKFKI